MIMFLHQYEEWIRKDISFSSLCLNPSPARNKLDLSPWNRVSRQTNDIHEAVFGVICQYFQGSNYWTWKKKYRVIALALLQFIIHWLNDLLTGYIMESLHKSGNRLFPYVTNKDNSCVGFIVQSHAEYTIKNQTTFIISHFPLFGSFVVIYIQIKIGRGSSVVDRSLRRSWVRSPLVPWSPQT